MSRARHSMKKPIAYSAVNSDPDVAKVFDEKKHGGKVVAKPEGGKAKARMDKRPRRAAGGRVGSDKHPMAPASSKSPMSSAASPKQNTEA